MNPVPAMSRLTAFRRDWFALLLGELTVTNIGFFAVLSMAAVYVSQFLQFSAGETSAVLLASTFGLRFARLLVAPWVDRIDPRRAIPASIALSIAGYWGIAVFDSPLAVGACLLIAGAGYGTNGMLVTTLASYVTEGSAFRRYVIMNTGTNVAASIGPIAANALMVRVHPAAPFLFAGAMLCLSLVVASRLRYRDDLPCIRSAEGWWRTAKGLLRDRAFLGAMALVVMGWFLYTQKFAAVPLYLGHVLGREAWVGALVAMNALIIIATSLPLGRWLGRRGIGAGQVVPLAYGLYGCGYFLMFCFATFEGIIAGVVVTSLAEGLLMPALNANIAERTLPGSRLTAFSLAAAAIGLGEGGGNVSGVMLVSYFHANQQPAMTFLILAICSLLCLTLAFRIGKRPAFSPVPASSTHAHIQPAEETV